MSYQLHVKRGSRYCVADPAIVLAAAAELRTEALVGADCTSSEVVRRFLRETLRDRPYEMFCCLHLNNRHRVIAFDELFRGTVDRASVHPREVVREVIRHNAAAVILAHNHPSGTTEPSQSDELITRRLKEALALIDVRVLDHMIVAGDSVFSFSEHGLL